MKLKTTTTSNGTLIEESSGNVFADLGLPNPQERLLKAEIAIQIRALVAQTGLTQAEAAARCGLTQPKINNIVRGRLQGFSVEKLLSIVNQLGHRVEVRISKRASEEAQTSVKLVP